MKIEARPWRPQDLLDDLQGIIDEESDNYLNTRRTTLEMALAYLKEHFAEPKWIPVTEQMPDNFTSVLGYMSDAGTSRLSGNATPWAMTSISLRCMKYSRYRTGSPCRMDLRRIKDER